MGHMARAGLDKEPHEVAAMFDTVAHRYDLTNDVLSMGQDRQWRKATIAALDAQRGDTVLDLAAGTGTSAEPLADAGVRVIPCDLSEGMLGVGKRRRPDLPFVAGNATGLPFADESFDSVTMSFGLRNVPDVPAALAELLRVTKPGGKVVICEFSTPKNKAFRKVYSGYLVKALPKVAGMVSKEREAYDYLAESISDWPDQRELGLMLKRAGWEHVAYRNLTGGVVALHRGTKPGGAGR